MEKPDSLLYFPSLGYSHLEEFLNSPECTNALFPVASANGRHVIHYGYAYNYRSGNVSTPLPLCENGKPFPDPIDALRELAEKLAELPENYFNQCIINRYLPGQGISAHVDANAYGHTIACFTFGSGAVMRFTKSGQYDQYVEPDSLYVMQNEARYGWKHEMPARKSDLVNGEKKLRGVRWSITFRAV